MLFSSVLASRMLLETTGCPYTCPSTAIEPSCPKSAAPTAADVSLGWFPYQPVRRLSAEFVVTSAAAGTGLASAITTTPPVVRITATSADSRRRIRLLTRGIRNVAVEEIVTAHPIEI